MALLITDMYPSLNDDMIRRLKTINVYNVYDFANEDTEKLGRTMKMPYQDVKIFKAQIIEAYGGKIRSGAELLELEDRSIVSTEIECLDILLNGGLHPGEIYELCGVSSAGKTQMCIGLAINIALKTKGCVRYIDTKSDFSAGRVHAILEAKGHDDEEIARVMNQIRITRVTNIYELLNILYNLTTSLKPTENEPPTRLVIIDSLPAIILASSENHESFYFLNHVANVSRFIATEFSTPLITVNLISEWREAEGFGAQIVAKPAIVKPTLGKFWLHVPNTRLMIEKLENEERKISVWKSADLQVGTSCKVNISETGVDWNYLLKLL